MLRVRNEIIETNLLEEMRDVTTLDGGIPVYSEADISIVEFDPRDVYPTALYVLQPNLENLMALRHQVDLFHLTEVTDHGEGVIAPPVVELSDGVPAIVDGIHRFYLAHILGETVNAVYVEGVNPEYPIISYPVGWEEVTVYPKKPEDPRLLRKLRVEDKSEILRQYYRDYSFMGSLGRRPRKGQYE